MITERHQCLFYRYCFYRAILVASGCTYKSVFKNVCRLSAVLGLCEVHGFPTVVLPALRAGALIKLLGFSRCSSRLWSTGLVVVARGLRRPMACGSSQIRIEPVSPALTG